MNVKFLSAAQAISKINDNDHVILGGFIGSVVPELLERSLEERFINTNSPKNLSIYFAAGQGDGDCRSVNHLAHEGLVKFVMGGHWGLVPKMQKLANEGKITGYNLPQGVIAHLFRDSAANKPGVITKVGLNTFVDPRIEGGKINSATTEDFVSLMNINQEEFLFYKKIYANVALLRGTTADELGNITMEEEGLYVENLAVAQLVKNNGGIVIVQVKRVVPKNTLNPQLVRIPGILVDTVVICDDENEHMQSFAQKFDPKYCSSRGMLGLDDENTSSVHMEDDLDIKTIIGRRCALELRKGTILNLGIGVPEYVAKVAGAEGILQHITLTVEPGAIGGQPAGGLNFGLSAYPQALVTQDQQFDFYDGGGLDQAFLGLAECDQQGNINVSRFGSKIAGCGGFINISQNTQEVFFCGTFTSGKGIEIVVENGKLNIVKDGDIVKFIDHVKQITFSGKQALLNKQKILYITERAVFNLTQQGLELIEIAPGVDLEKDILEKISFKPIVSKDLKLMDARIFQKGLMGLSKKFSSQ